MSVKVELIIWLVQLFFVSLHQKNNNKRYEESNFIYSGFGNDESHIL